MSRLHITLNHFNPLQITLNHESRELQGDIEDMVSDIIAAVRWTTENVERFNGDPDKIVLAGQSAGES